MTIADRAVLVTGANRGNGAENGEVDLFPDPQSQTMAESWRSGAVKAFERELSALAEAEPVAS